MRRWVERFRGNDQHTSASRQFPIAIHRHQIATLSGRFNALIELFDFVRCVCGIRSEAQKWILRIQAPIHPTGYIFGH